jgi:ligand-binding sensor domain-containing protein
LFIGEPEGSEYRFRHYPNPPAAGGIAAYGINIDSNRALWFGCGQAVCAFSGERLMVLGREAGIPPDRWDAILPDGDGNLWIRSPNEVRVRHVGSSFFVKNLAIHQLNSNCSVSLHPTRKGV